MLGRLGNRIVRKNHVQTSEEPPETRLYAVGSSESKREAPEKVKI